MTQLCETNPMDTGETVCTVPVGASEETPDGVTTSGAERAKQSQLAEVSSVKFEVSGKTAGMARPTRASHAKQSQFAGSRPEGVAGACAKQSQFARRERL